MAALVRSAPVPRGSSGAQTGFPAAAQASRCLLEKVLIAIPETHRSCVHVESLILNSTENGKLEIMASNIGVPPAPELQAIGDNFTLEMCVRRMSEGLQLHVALLQSVVTRLANQDKVKELLVDTRNLLIPIHKMLKLLSEPQPPAPTVALRLPGEYDVQVATHLTLDQFQSFGQYMVRSLRNITQEDHH